MLDNFYPRPEQDAGHEWVAQWTELCNYFSLAQGQKPSERLKLFGELFERIQPWLEGSIKEVSRTNYYLVSTETIVTLLFVLLLKRNQLPPSNPVFKLWVESLALSKANKLIEEGACLQGSPGEASIALQQKFNRLNKRHRAMFYLYIVEKGSLPEVSRAIGLTNDDVRCQLPMLADKLSVPEDVTPYNWRKNVR
jgi:hypothetical protein